MSISVPYYDNYKIFMGRDKVGWYQFGVLEEWKKVNLNQLPYFEDLMTLSRKRSYVCEDDVIDAIRSILAYEEKGNDIVSVSEDDKVGIIENLINFFSEFHFEPNFRFINTFSHMVKKGLHKDYIINYFKLTDSPYTSSIQEKMKSSEFNDVIVESFKKVTPTKKINRRFKLYYGSQGTGKTTVACQETDGRCIVCHSSVLPQDIMEDFKFNDSKAEFSPSAFYDAMVNGKSIVLDEINLLPFDTLRFLQSIVDGKSEFIYKGQVVKIKEGFEVIGTMNLVVNGCTYPLPDPLIDRAYDLVEFKLSATDLLIALD